VGLEDRAKEHIAARDAAAAQQDEALAQWQARQRARVQGVLSEFVQLVRRYGVVQVPLFYVLPVVKKPLFGGKKNLEFRFQPIAQVWEIGPRSEQSLEKEILTVTEGLQVIRAIRIQNASGNHVLALESRCARTFPPYSMWLRPEDIESTDLQPDGLEAFTISPIGLAASAAVMAYVSAGIYRDEPPWIERVVDRAAVAIIDHNARR
jgi:hypothetical protein